MKNPKEFYGWTERKLKGNIAETIVEHMLEYSGYRVYRFGYERTLEKIKELKVKRSFEKRQITSMPDFIAVDENGKMYFIEVKYRERGLTHWKDKKIMKNLNKTWPDARLIVVSLNEPYFSISVVKDYIETDKLIRLEDDEHIKINKDVIKRYEELVKKYYTKNEYRVQS